MSKRDLYNIMFDYDINEVLSAFHSASENGCDTFIECYDDVTEWTFIDEYNETQNGMFKPAGAQMDPNGNYISFDEQVLDAKIRLAKLHGWEIQNSRLHVASKRGDRHDW